MIVNQHQKGWEIIYHRAHALLAAEIAGHWNAKERPIRWLETIAAISHHDDLEKEWEEKNITEAGAPLDFTLIQDIDVPKLRQLTQNARYRGRWVAMLISMHMSFLHEGNRGQLPELDEFIDEQLKNQEEWRQELNITKDDAVKAYEFFQWCDRLSLILCKNEVPIGERALEIATLPDGKRYDVMQGSDGNLTVTPWPFQEKEFTVNVEACYVEQLQFASSAELSQALQTAPIKTLEWTFVE
jgi:hypothetical protein